MADGDNKEKLVSFLTNEWASQIYLGKFSGKELFVTSRDRCYKIYVRNSEILSEIAPALECTQVEADTRVVLHASHACSSQGGGHSIVKNTGGWLNSLGSGILVEKRYFGVLQKY